MTLVTVPLLAGGTAGGRLHRCARLRPSQPQRASVVKIAAREPPPVSIRTDGNVSVRQIPSSTI